MPDEAPPDILADSAGTTACPKCSEVVDVSHAPAFSHVDCPHCGRGFTAPGRLGHFILLRLLGQGQMGATFKAYDKSLGRYVAVKVMQKAFGDDRQRARAFLAEGRALASLDHPNAVRVFSIGEEKGQPYIVMELVTGTPLDRQYSLTEPIDEGLGLEIAIQIARALQAANKIGLIHSDIKPANVMIEKSRRARLVDFGVARFGGGQLGEGTVFGTPYYVAPEQVQRGSVDHRTDIYALGATLFHVLACLPPFPGKTVKEVLRKRLKEPAPDLRTIRPSLHAETAEIVAKMLSRKPDDRYATYEELLKDLGHAHEVITGRGFGAEEALAPKGRKRRRWLVAVPLLIVLVVAAVAVIDFVVHRPPPGPPPPPPPVPQVDLPVFSPPGGVIDAPVEVTIGCDTEGAQIRYTTDRSDPTRQSALFEAKIRVSPGTTLKARAYRKGYKPSAIVTAKYAPRTATLAEVVPVRTEALAAWEKAQKLVAAGGLQAPFEKAKLAHKTAEEFYERSAYDEAKAAYEKLLALCNEMTKLAAERQPALKARKAAEQAIQGLLQLEPKVEAEATWPQLRQQAEEAFAKGQFAEAARLWQSAGEKAKARHDALVEQIGSKWVAATVEIDRSILQQYAAKPWKQARQAAAEARKLREAGEFLKARKQYQVALKHLAEARKVAEAARAEAETVQEAVREARALWDEHKYHEALRRVEKALAAYPKNTSLQENKDWIEQRLYLTLPLTGPPKRRKPTQPPAPTDIRLVLTPPGEFTMGSPKNEPGRKSDEVPHQVTLSRPFYVATREVTVRQFRLFTEAGKGYQTDAEKSGAAMALQGGQWRSRKGVSWKKPGFDQTDDDPVVCVSWNDAWAFCKWLSALSKREVQLPTEAQWEYACRAGTQTRFSFGDRVADLHKYANYADQAANLPHGDAAQSDGRARTAPVGAFQPNPWGLYDTHGNAGEWCNDMYGAYPRRPVTDPKGMVAGKYPLIRGGSWFDPPARCRAAARDQRRKDFASGATGFRVTVKAED